MLKSCEETKTADNVTSDAESRQNESDSTPIEPQAGMSIMYNIIVYNFIYYLI